MTSPGDLVRQGGRAIARVPEKAPSLPAPVAAPTRTLFRGIATLRGKRALHPNGFASTATVTALGIEEMQGVELFERPAQHEAILRWSRATGVPKPLPDALGLAVRIPDAYGPERHQDLLLTSSLPLPGSRHLPLPALGGFAGTLFSSLLSFEIAGETRLVSARATPARRSSWDLDGWRAESQGQTFELSVASPRGPWKQFAELAVGQPVPDEIEVALEMNPWNSGGGIEPRGPLMDLRAPAYEGSIAGRRSRGG